MESRTACGLVLMWFIPLILFEPESLEGSKKDSRKTIPCFINRGKERNFCVCVCVFLNNLGKWKTVLIDSPCGNIFLTYLQGTRKRKKKKTEF